MEIYKCNKLANERVHNILLQQDEKYEDTPLIPRISTSLHSCTRAQQQHIKCERKSSTKPPYQKKVIVSSTKYLERPSY